MKYAKCIMLFAASIFFWRVDTHAQTSKADSLALVIEKYPKNDTTKAHLMSALALMLAYSNPSRASKIIDEELPLSEGLHYIKGILDGYNIKSSLYIIQGNYQEGLAVCEKYLKTAKQYNDLLGLMGANNRIGIIYSQSSNYPKALEYMLAGLKIAESLNDKSRMAATNQNIGNIYNDMEDYDKALEYYKISISITETIVPKAIVPPSLYNNIGTELIHQKKYDAAVEYLEKGRAISLQIDNKRSLAGALTNLADAFHHLGDNEKSYQYGIQALELSRQIGDRRALANNFINTGIAINEVSDATLEAQRIDPKDRFAAAIAKLDSAIQISTEMGDIVTREQAYKCKSEISEKQKNYPLAISSLLLYSQLHDTILNNDNQKGVIRKIAQYEFDKKEAEIKLQQQITESKLKEQELLSLQGQQQLKINQNELALSNKDRDLQRLTLQKQQADYLKEKQEKDNIQAISDQKDRINALQAANQRRFRYGLMGGILLLAIIGGLVYRQSAIRKTANQKLIAINAQLDEANKIKARLFGILTHDLRSPIASLINYLNLQKEAPALLTPEMKNQHQQKMVHSAEELLATIEDLLLWSKGQMKNFKPQIKIFPVSQLFDEIKTLYPDNGSTEIGFELPQGMTIHSDENYLKTIIRNLTANAIKAVRGKPKGQILWKAWEQAGHKLISISDNGPGISAAQQQILFSEDAAIGGKNGLGLSLVRDFAAAIHCKLSINSQPGQGAVFTLDMA
jgi:signal transduction histidine kinase